MTATAPTMQANYDAFVEALTALTRRYGVAIQSIGGVTVADEPDAFRNIIYVADITSGDLYPRFAESR